MTHPMSEPYFQQIFADRIGGSNYGQGTEIYKFEKIKRAKRKARSEHPQRKLVDFGIGENDEMAPESVRQTMAEEINRPENRGYADNGIEEFKNAAVRFMRRNFNVELDSETEVIEFKQSNDQVVRKHPGTSCTASGLVCTEVRVEAEALVISVIVDFTSESEGP